MPTFLYISGVDIGYSCTHDVQCTLGNGGEYSKCNKDLNICICTINHIGEYYSFFTVSLSHVSYSVLGKLTNFFIRRSS